MEKYIIVKLSSFVLLIILLLSGCNKIDNKSSLSTTTLTATPTAMPTTISTLEPSPSALPFVMASTPTPSFDSQNSIEDNKTTNGPAKEEVKNELCSEDEDVLLSFKIANSDKIASICISKQESGYIIYRYGKPEDIELEYPDKTESSWDEFTYSYYLRGGGAANEGMDLNYLDFVNGDFNYEIYQEYDSVSDETTVGITVTNLKTGEETDIQGDGNSIKGSLIDLKDNDKVNIIMQ